MRKSKPGVLVNRLGSGRYMLASPMSSSFSKLYVFLTNCIIFALLFQILSLKNKTNRTIRWSNLSQLFAEIHDIISELLGVCLIIGDADHGADVLVVLLQFVRELLRLQQVAVAEPRGHLLDLEGRCYFILVFAHKWIYVDIICRWMERELAKETMNELYEEWY